jgi:hypothetical protein
MRNLRIKGLSGFLLGFCLVTLLIAPRVQAGQANTSVFANAVELTDPELRGMRGRFINKDNIIEFGLVMDSNISLSAGGSINTGMTVSFSSTTAIPYQPHVDITYSESGDNQAEETPGATVNVAGTGNITGIVQSIHVAGDDNGVRQDMAIDIKQVTTPAAPGGTPITAPYSTTRGAGDKTTFIVNSNEAGYTTDLGHGQIKQAIMSGQGLLQSTQLESSMNSITNNIGLTVGVSTFTTNDMLNLKNSMLGLTGLPCPTF